MKAAGYWKVPAVFLLKLSQIRVRFLLPAGVKQFLISSKNFNLMKY